MLIALALAAAAATPVLLTPTGKWVVDYEKDMCVLSRGYLRDGQTLNLGFLPYPMGSETEMLLLAAGKAPEVRGRKVEVTLLPRGSSTVGTFTRYVLDKPRQALTRLTLRGDALAGIEAADSIAIRLDGGDEYRFATPAIAAGLSALTACQADLLRGWGLDPAERDRVVIPPKGNPAASFGADAYPVEALRAHQQGRAIAAVTVDEHGAAVGCSIVSTSGSPILDHGSCAALKRSRFEPGRDRNGQPTSAHVVVPVRWLLP